MVYHFSEKKKEEAYCDTKWKEAGLEKAGQRPHKEKEEKRKYKNSFMGNKDEVA